MGQENEVRKVRLFMHGAKFKGVNPGMTPEGKAQVAAKKHLLPEEIYLIFVGTGRRHQEMADIFDIGFANVSPIVGKADGLEIHDGKKVIVLGDGSGVVPYEEYDPLSPKVAKDFLVSLPNDSIILGSREIMVALGKPEAESASVWEATIRGEEFSLELIG